MRYLLLATTLIVAGCTFHKSELDETLEWMDNTYNPHDGVSMAFGHGKTAWYAPSKNMPGGEEKADGSSETFTYGGCELTIHYQDDCAGARSEMCFSYKQKFHLGDFDPESIKVSTFAHMGGFRCEDFDPASRQALGMNCDHAEIALSTRTAAPLVEEDNVMIFPKLTGKDHEIDSKTKANSVDFEVNDVEYAGRFAKALRHAVELCGGKAPAF